MEVPGIQEKDIDVTVEGNTLTVNGERKFEKDGKEENCRRIERRYGSFSRSFTLPSSVDPNQVSAHYDKGVLMIDLAKRQKPSPNRSRSVLAVRRPSSPTFTAGSPNTRQDNERGREAE
jgi:HSP20 family protein